MRLVGATLALNLFCFPSGSAQSRESSNRDASTPSANCGITTEVCQEDWNGRRGSEGKFQAIVLHVVFSATGPKATVDLPEFGALGIPASKFGMAGGKIHFELVGDLSTTFFDGSFSSGIIQGMWKENDRVGNFELKRVPNVDRAFYEHEVSFLNGDVRLAGTLLIPKSPAPASAVVFVQGSGPEQRYASRFLAVFFVHRGVAALIYDKRGAGQSTGDWKHSSFDDLAGDVVSAVNFLKHRPEINPKRIGLMGSSQGGWIAPMAAVQLPEVAFVIVKSAAPLSPEKQELGRVVVQMRAEGDSPDDITEALALYRRAIAYARTGEGWDALSHEIAADSRQRWTMFEADTPKDYWFFGQIRSDFNHDPLAVLRQIKVPLLVIFGGIDENAPPLSDSIGGLLEAMRASGGASELEIFPGAGHDLRVEPGKGQPSDFSRFAVGYLDSLANWVKLQTQR